MSVEFAYRFKQDAPPADLQDLDVVALTAAVTTDDGEEAQAGTEGTIVGTYNGGEAYVIELAEPAGATASVAPHQIRFVERAAP